MPENWRGGARSVHILERRSHIGGNIYDYDHEDGLLVQKYGPHCFFTEHQEIREYVERFAPVRDCFQECVAMIDGKVFPMPFNFRSIDMLYDGGKARELKSRILHAFQGREFVAVAELNGHEDELIAEYGRFMYENEYRLYTAKQWGRPIESVSPSVFGRVPVYLSYKRVYEPHAYQFVPEKGFTDLAKRMLDHPLISYELNVDALSRLRLDESGRTFYNGRLLQCPVVYTGALDELFGLAYGRLPYRSLEFIWKTVPAQEDTFAVTAWPQAEKVTRVTNYANLPKQDTKDGKTVIAIEVPFEYDPDKPFGNEPYYLVDNDETRALYKKYRERAKRYPKLFLAGRLADYRYYNMDHTIMRAWEVAEEIYRGDDARIDS